MKSANKGNYGYIVKSNNDGGFALCTFTNVRGLNVEAWVAATTLDIKNYKSEKVAVKKGNQFLTEN